MELVQEKAYVYTLQQVGAGDSRFMDIFKSLCNVDNQQGEKFWNIPLSRTYEKRKHNFFSSDKFNKPTAKEVAHDVKLGKFMHNNNNY